MIDVRSFGVITAMEFTFFTIAIYRHPLTVGAGIIFFDVITSLEAGKFVALRINEVTLIILTFVKIIGAEYISMGIAHITD